VTNSGRPSNDRTSSCSAVRKGISSQAAGRASQSRSSSSACQRTSPPPGPVASFGDWAWQIVSAIRRANVSSGMMRPSSSTGISRHARRAGARPGCGAAAAMARESGVAAAVTTAPVAARAAVRSDRLVRIAVVPR
jgi:hypothetical protein